MKCDEMKMLNIMKYPRKEVIKEFIKEELDQRLEDGIKLGWGEALPDKDYMVRLLHFLNPLHEMF